MGNSGRTSRGDDALARRLDALARLSNEALILEEAAAPESDRRVYELERWRRDHYEGKVWGSVTAALAVIAVGLAQMAVTFAVPNPGFWIRLAMGLGGILVMLAGLVLLYQGLRVQALSSPNLARQLRPRWGRRG